MIKSDFFRFFYQIVRINRYTMSTNTTRRVVCQESKRLIGSSFNNIDQINSHLVKRLSKLIDVSNIDITKSIFNNFRCFSLFDGCHFIYLRVKKRTIEISKFFTSFFCQCTNITIDIINRSFFISWTNPFWAVRKFKIDSSLHS